MKYICTICGYIYDEEKEQTKFEDLPDDWACPMCGAPKAVFKLLVENQENEEKIETKKEENVEIKKEKIENEEEIIDDDMQKLTYGEMSILCSNLARGCEKQYKFEEEKLFKKIAKYYEEIAPKEENPTVENLKKLNELDINENYVNANSVIDEKEDRGAKRANTWGEKVTKIISSLLKIYEDKGEEMFQNKEVWICTVCGFIYIGENPPARCPVCRVPNTKFQKVGGKME